MKRLRRIRRLIHLAMHVFVGVLITVLFAGIWQPAFYPRLVSWWLGKAGRIVGVTVKVVGKPAEQAVLMVANHISWLDIPLLGGVTNARFLSKQEVRQWPVIGWLAAKSGTLFITRGKAGAAAQAATTILQTLQAGSSVLLFPEGTTTTGDNVGTFHARLFAPAFDANAAVQPIVVRYPGLDGLTHPVVPYVGQQSLWDNLKALLAEANIQVEIHFLPLMTTTGTDRRALAAACEQRIRAVINANCCDLSGR